MNFKIITILSLFVLCACGVKGDPSYPKDANLPSVMKQYPDIKLEKPLEETKKK